MSTGWKILAILGGLLILVGLLAGAFALGMRLGEVRTARTLMRNLPPPPPGTMPPGPAWLAAHGVFGTVESVDLQDRSIAVVNDGGQRYLILLCDDTVLERFREKIDLTKIKVGEQIVAIGAPDDEGRIVARAIRALGVRKKGSLWPAAISVGRWVYRITHPWFLWID